MGYGCVGLAERHQCQFSSMLSYADPDYWLGALLLAFESHQKGPLERTAGLPPIVLGFPESDNQITDLQINVPPAAMVAFFAGRAYRCPKCPTTKYVMDVHGLPQVTGQASQEALQAFWPMLDGCDADPLSNALRRRLAVGKGLRHHFSQSCKVSGSQLREAPIIHLCLGFVLRLRHVIHRAGRAFVGFGRDADDRRRGCRSVHFHRRSHRRGKQAL